MTTAFLTLHVGAGTYRPMRVEKIADHRMHSERSKIPQATADAIAATRAAGGRLCVHTPQSAASMANPPDGTVRRRRRDEHFITPTRFKVVNRLEGQLPPAKIDAAHARLAFAGYDNIRAAYARAVTTL